MSGLESVAGGCGEEGRGGVCVACVEVGGGRGLRGWGGSGGG